MKVEKNYYVIMKLGDIGVDNKTGFAADSYCEKFTGDIMDAVKFGSRIAALYAKNDYEVNRNHGYVSDFHIVPLKVTYEW